MINTRFYSTTPGPRPRPSDEAGDTLIEVLIGAVVVVLVVVATMTALNNSNRATALTRARAQADALAQQNEDELRGEPIKRLSELSETHSSFSRAVSSGGTTYTIVSTARYISDKTSTASCTASSSSADYIQTNSEVTWPGIGKSKPVKETGIISPPPDSAIITQVNGASGEPVSGMTVEATGPSNASGETASDGCAILAVSPGEYKVNVSRPGYVDPNGYKNSSEDPSTTGSFYVIAEQTVKKSFEFAKAGAITAKFSGAAPAEWDQFSVFNTGMTSLRSFGTLESFPTAPPGEVASGSTVFPFTSTYIVYAGTCEADLPTANGQASNTEALVSPGSSTLANVPIAPIKLQVSSGLKSEAVKKMTSYSGTLTDGCSTKHKFSSNALGELPRPGLPFGTYSLCVTGTVSGKSKKTTVSVHNNVAAGTATTVYLGEGETGASCP